MMFEDWKGRRVVIVGAARQGLALARYLLLHGASVTLTDQRARHELAREQDSLRDLEEAGLALRWQLGGHPLDLLDEADLLCLSGGVALTIPLVQEALARGIPLSNDSQIFLEAAPCKVIGITGSAGKTTTTVLVGRMATAGVELGEGYHNVWVGGNIGSPLIAEVDRMEADDLAVVELSSFQLEIMDRSPHIAAILNITPNHLDRHGTMGAYTAAKANIVAHQSDKDWAVLGRDDPGAWSLRGLATGALLSFGLSQLAGGQAGIFASEGQILYQPAFEANWREATETEAIAVPLLKRDQIALRGEHNLLNVMAACAVCVAAGFSALAMQAGVRDFGGVPHRLEFICTWNGADWYNDSIATAPERAMAAIRSFSEPLVLLAGGRDKNLPWDEFAQLVKQRVDHLILFGEAAGLIEQAMKNVAAGRCEVFRCAKLYEAVQLAAQIVQPGDVVLFSPGGTSFDEFKDFEERGECFAYWVRNLATKAPGQDLKGPGPV